MTKLIPVDNGNYGLGSYVSLSKDGNTAVVSHPGRAFTRIGGTWIEVPLVPTKLGATAISADGSTIFVGGSIYVKGVGGWTEQKSIPYSPDYSSRPAAFSADGNTLIVRGYGPEIKDTVFIYTRTGTTWTQKAALNVQTTLEETNWRGVGFGSSVAISPDGRTALVGAFQDWTLYYGEVYAYTLVGDVWMMQAKFTPVNKTNLTSEGFGYNVALLADGNTALISAIYASEGSTQSNGAVYVFTRNGWEWTQQTKLVASDKSNHAFFGSSIDLSADGTIALIGADGDVQEKGSVYFYTQTNGVWIERQKIISPNSQPMTRFGWSVALSGDASTALIGETGGSVYVYGNPPGPTPTPVPIRADTIGAYKNGMWYLRNSNSSGNADLIASFGGDASDFPVAGDWNGDGVDTIGVYRANIGKFFLSDSNTAPNATYTVLFGNPNDRPFVGRWRSDMVGDGIGVFRWSNGILYQKRALTNGVQDYYAIFGNAGDVAVAGDWNGDSHDSIGVYRAHGESKWYLSYSSEPNGITYSDLWFAWNIGNGTPVVGDWNGDRVSTVGYLNSSGVFTLHSTLSSSGTDQVFSFGPIGSKPVAGKWTAPMYPSRLGVVLPVENRVNGANDGTD
jgi:hypothetical protein